MVHCPPNLRFLDFLSVVTSEFPVFLWSLVDESVWVSQTAVPFPKSHQINSLLE